MKKSSLLALSLVSLVALVGCGKKDAGGAKKVSAEDFDAKGEAIQEEWDEKSAEDPEFDPFHYYAKIDYKYSAKVTGTYIDPNVPSGKYSSKASFHVIYSGGWVIDPDEAEEYDEEDLAVIDEIISDAFSYDNYPFYGVATYFEEYYAAQIEAGAMKFEWYLPFKAVLSQFFAGEFTEPDPDDPEADPIPATYSGSFVETIKWNDSGETTYYQSVEKYEEKYEGHPELDCSYVETYEYKITYQAVPEKYLA